MADVDIYMKPHYAQIWYLTHIHFFVDLSWVGKILVLCFCIKSLMLKLQIFHTKLHLLDNKNSKLVKYLQYLFHSLLYLKCNLDGKAVFPAAITAGVTWFFINHSDLLFKKPLLLSNLKTVNILSAYFFQDSIMNRMFKRTVFIYNKSCIT